MTDPSTRYADLAIRFRIEDGDDAGCLTHGYGGIWDRDLSPRDGYCTTWDPQRQLYVPRTSASPDTSPKISRVSAQATPLVADIWTRTTLALGGRRSGKSYGAAQKCAVLVVRFPGRPGMVLSPTYRQAKNVFKHVLRVVPREWLLPGKLGVRWSNEAKELHFVNGASIVFRTADNAEGCRSDGAAWLLVDEWQDVSDEAYDNAHSSLSEGGDDYLIVITATIKPELRARYDRLKDIETNSVGLSKIIRMRSRGNPFIGHAMFDEAAMFMDATRIEQEHDAIWPELVGRIYWPFQDDHVQAFPLEGREDATSAILHEQFGGPPSYDEKAFQFFISVDPPHSAAIWKLYDDRSMHLVHEVLVGADGVGGDVRTLSERCKAITSGRAVIVRDPHDRGYDNDMRKYFNWARNATLRRIAPEYRITSMRAQMGRGNIYVSPDCPHAIEVLKRHQYKQNAPGQPDKFQAYERSHQKGSKRIQLVHLADAMGYGVYKMHPAKYEYEAHETEKAA